MIGGVLHDQLSADDMPIVIFQKHQGDVDWTAMNQVKLLRNVWKHGTWN